jgi:uncharacterized protein YggE
MKYLCLTLAMLAISSTLLSQNNTAEKFIEVTVEDTLKAEPDYFEYAVSITPYTADEDMASYKDDFLVEKYQREVSDAHEKLQQVLKKHKIRYKSNKSSIYLKSPGPADTSFEYVLPFNNSKQLSSFYDDIKEIQQIEGYIIFSKSSKSDMYEKKLTEKVIAKAWDKASLMAQAAQVKLGSVIQIREMTINDLSLPSPADSGWTAYPPLHVLPQNLMADLLQITYKITLTVRFAIEN